MVEKYTTPRYAGWTIYKDTRNGKTSWHMTHPANIYQIAVYNCKGEWIAELLTTKHFEGRTTWEPARNACEGSVAEVVTEANKRIAYHLAKAGK